MRQYVTHYLGEFFTEGDKAAQRWRSLCGKAVIGGPTGWSKHPTCKHCQHITKTGRVPALPSKLHGTKTGRFDCSKPNISNFKARFIGTMDLYRQVTRSHP